LIYFFIDLLTEAMC